MTITVNAAEIATASKQVVQIDVVDSDGRIARAFIQAKATNQGVQFKLSAMKRRTETTVKATATYKDAPR